MLCRLAVLSSDEALDEPGSRLVELELDNKLADEEAWPRPRSWAAAAEPATPSRAAPPTALEGVEWGGVVMIKPDE